MKKRYVSAVLVAGLLSAGSSLACGFHDGYGSGAYGIQWRPYDPSESIESPNPQPAANAKADVVAQAQQKTRPVFSSSASRAIEAAKARSLKSGAQSSEDQTSADSKADPVKT